MEKSILITGCSSGIGLCAALSLHKRGYHVFATARKETDLKKLKDLGLQPISLDINHSLSIRDAVSTVMEISKGQLYAVFNNSGYVQAGAVEDLSREDIRKQFETNVFGPIELVSLVLPYMRKQGVGRIIQNSSMLGVITMPYIGAYNASKFALDGFTHTLRQELMGTHIHVSIIAPGPIKSKLRENAKQYFSVDIEKPGVHQEAYRKIAQRYSAAPSKRDMRISLEPQAVVNDLIHALESRRPHSHYYVGGAAKLFAIFRRFFPEKWVDHLIKRFT